MSGSWEEAVASLSRVSPPLPKITEARKENHSDRQQGPRAAGNHGNSSLQGMAETNPK